MALIDNIGNIVTIGVTAKVTKDILKTTMVKKKKKHRKRCRK